MEGWRGDKFREDSLGRNGLEEEGGGHPTFLLPSVHPPSSTPSLPPYLSFSNISHAYTLLSQIHSSMSSHNNTPLFSLSLPPSCYLTPLLNPFLHQATLRLSLPLSLLLSLHPATLSPAQNSGPFLKESS